MPQKKRKSTPPKPHGWRAATSWPRRQWQKGIWQRIAIVLTTVVFAVTAVSYGVAQWYIATQRSKPLVWGATFSPYYAEYFGLDPQDTLEAIITDLGVKQLARTK